MINVVQINWRKLLPENMWQKNQGTKNRLVNDRKYKQQIQSDLIQKWISNSLQYKRTFSVALYRYLLFSSLKHSILENHEK